MRRASANSTNHAEAPRSSASGQRDGAYLELIPAARRRIEHLQLDAAGGRAARDVEGVLQEDAHVAVRIHAVCVDRLGRTRAAADAMDRHAPHPLVRRQVLDARLDHLHEVL
eukprot:CAMPEP_0182840474 /NCGR_PEP_ID=MMETSP0006_2-20121128/24470_1 /TAXON_ID=97485 /ORGANISM="Prymnesium parvum, Strain Texoma1" /LENGTH=111 /DNA_ID=CAMNT_0024969795 /DNA_START=313 /DNA_END=646 /DNA_ORIENTATION=-